MSTGDRIPLARPWFGEEEVDAVRRVLASGWVVQGPEVQAFEQMVAAMHELPHAVAVSSATAGLHLAFLALGLGPGDVILIPSFAWPSAANMAARAGAIPFFIDVEARTANLSSVTLREGLERARQAGLPKPKALVVIHEFGLPAPMAEILPVAREQGLVVIEDAACALGARQAGKPLGHFGRAAIFSFHPRKSISTGEGGMVVTADGQIADAIRGLRNHGQEVRDGRREFTSAGFNYRLTELQAAVGRVQLGRFAEILQRKRTLVAAYFEELAGVAGLALPPNDPEHTWQTFMVVLESEAIRAHVQARCHALGVECGPGSVAGHRGAVWGGRFVAPVDQCPVSTRLATCGLALPLSPQMTRADIARVSNAMRAALAG